jgi:hypothetical protein
MSFNSVSQPTQTLCQQDFTLVNGTLAGVPIGGTIGGVTYQNFNPQTSRIIGVKGKTLGTVAAFQNVSVNVLTSSIAANLANQGLVTLFSSVNTDTSVYTVFWVNTVYPGLSPC